MAEEKATKEVLDTKKKQKNIFVLLGIAVLVGVGIYYFMNSKNMSTSSPTDTNVSITPISENDSASSNSDTELTSKKWMWVKTQMSDGLETLPSKEGVFGLTFGTDLSLLASTDCNNGKGTYELGSDNSMTIGPMATTMMFCEGSTEPQFYQNLNNVGSYKISDGQLWLMLKFDSGTMIFE